MIDLLVAAGAAVILGLGALGSLTNATPPKSGALTSASATARAIAAAAPSSGTTSRGI